MLNKLRRAVVKEELVAITEDYIEAIVLGQMMYWAERVNDFDMLIKEENERILKYCTGDQEAKTHELLYGWIYKKATELKEEIMLPDSEKTVNRKLNSLVEKGYLERRNNPVVRYDRTYQYRVNYENIFTDMIKKGYMPQDYAINLQFIYNILKSQTEKSQGQIDVCNGQNDSQLENDEKNMKNVSNFEDDNVGQKTFQGQNDACKGQFVGTIPKITSESTRLMDSFNQSINLSNDNNQRDDGGIDETSNKGGSVSLAIPNNVNRDSNMRTNSFIEHIKEKYKLTDLEMELCLSRIRNRKDIKNIPAFLETVVKNYCEKERQIIDSIQGSAERNIDQESLHDVSEIIKIGGRVYDAKKLEDELLGRPGNLIWEG